MSGDLGELVGPLVAQAVQQALGGALGEHPVDVEQSTDRRGIATGFDRGVGEPPGHELRDLLHRRGLPAGSVRFIHEARNDLEKAACSPPPARAASPCSWAPPNGWGWAPTSSSAPSPCTTWICPWRPADLAQRDGRILRQGNHNPEVQILRYVTEGSFDAYSWQTVTRKAGFIGQVMRGRLDLREIDDIGDTALSYDEVKALATGDPRILEKARLDAEIARLERLERAHHRDHAQLTHTARDADRLAESLTAEADLVTAAITTRTQTHGQAFHARIGAATHTNRADAGRAILATINHALRPGAAGSAPETVGVISGFPLRVAVHQNDTITLTLDGVPRSTVHLRTDGLQETDPAGLASRIKNRITALDRIAQDLAVDIAEARREAERARTQQGQPFVHADRLRGPGPAPPTCTGR